jgi:phage shock protein PspC (stress-responsive transcriptional regulator)
MNRTITMNLSGIIFHIEEDAYDKLNKYLSTIKGYFKDSEGKDEIMSDIEARIAEMLQEKVSKTKQAVLMMDVESVIAVMGKPEDFAGENTITENTSNNESTANESKATWTNGKRRRVFRDTDDKILGGVCSGISSYFDFDPLWLRAAFAISFFVFGSGLLLYIILCIIIPKAKTTAEKLEMRGEKVDVNNIGKAVNEEFEEFKKKVKEFGNEVNSKENKDRIKSSAEKFFDFLGDLFHNVFKVVGKFFIIIFVIIAIILMVGLLATFFGRGTISVFGAHGFSLYEFRNAFLPADMPIELIVIALVLLIGVPLLSIIYKGIKHLFGIKEKNKIVKYTANALWLGGVALLLFIGYQVIGDFSEEASSTQKIELKQPISQVLYLDLKPMADDMDFTYRHTGKINFGDWSIISKDDSKYKLAYPKLDIVASETDSFQLVVIKSANGFNKKEATYRARNIDYNVTQADSTIWFNAFYEVNNTEKLRAQDVQIVLKVPMNKVIYLSDRLERIIFDIKNIHKVIDSDMTGRRWIMTRKGLDCIDCQGLEYNDELDLPAPPPAPIAPPASLASLATLATPATAATSTLSAEEKKYFVQPAVTFK